MMSSQHSDLLSEIFRFIFFDIFLCVKRVKQIVLPLVKKFVFESLNANKQTILLDKTILEMNTFIYFQ